MIASLPSRFEQQKVQITTLGRGQKSTPKPDVLVDLMETLPSKFLYQRIKTHFPERRGYLTYSTTKRIILLVRNPYDSIDSYWNMCCTNTHTERICRQTH